MFVYLVYCVFVLVIFVFGFLFEFVFDCEFYGGYRIVVCGFFMVVVIGAASGLFV